MDYANLFLGCRKLVIAPIVSGGGTAGRILIGVALIALAFVPFGGAFAGFAAGAAANAATGTAAVAAGFSIGSGILFSLGTSLLLTGIASLLTPPVSNPKSDTDKKDSFLFDRAAELTTQGNPVPILYGRFLAGSPLVISSAITTQQVPV
jgi:predicted phage tail protein